MAHFSESLERCPTPLVRVGGADTFALTALDLEVLMTAFGLAVDDAVAAAERALQRK